MNCPGNCKGGPFACGGCCACVEQQNYVALDGARTHIDELAAQLDALRKLPAMVREMAVHDNCRSIHTGRLCYGCAPYEKAADAIEARIGEVQND